MLARTLCRSSALLMVLFLNMGCSDQMADPEFNSENQAQSDTKIDRNSSDDATTQSVQSQIQCLNKLAQESGDAMITFIVTRPEEAMTHVSYAPERLNDDQWERLGEFYQKAAQDCIL